MPYMGLDSIPKIGGRVYLCVWDFPRLERAIMVGFHEPGEVEGVFFMDSSKKSSLIVPGQKEGAKGDSWAPSCPGDYGMIAKQLHNWLRTGELPVDLGEVKLESAIPIGKAF